MDDHYTVNHLSLIGRRKFIDWTAILIFFSLLNLLLVAGLAYLFIRIQHSDIFRLEREGTERFEALDRRLLRQVISHFAERENRFADLRKEKPQAVDPSL